MAARDALTARDFNYRCPALDVSFIFAATCDRMQDLAPKMCRKCKGPEVKGKRKRGPSGAALRAKERVRRVCG
jgi:hypothetical protein